MNREQNILISGSSSGFGFLTTVKLLQEGYTVFASMREPDGKNAAKANVLNNIAKETDGRLYVLDLDVTDPASVEKSVKQALDAENRIDVLLNNAGYGVSGYLETVTDDQLKKQFEVNVFGLQRLTRAVLPSMRSVGKGLIINISSVMGRVVIPFAGAYTASKWAVEGLSESYRYELAGTGVEVVVIEPGGFGTNFFANMVNGKDSQRLESYGSLADLPNQLWGNVGENLNGDNAPNPQLIADTVLNLIQAPAGKRPFRTVVDPMSGGQAPTALNDLSDKLQRQILDGMGMESLLSVKIRS